MEPTKKRSTFKIVLTTLGVIFALGILIIGGLIFLARNSLRGFDANEKQRLISHVDQFIKDINQNKASEAYQLTDKKDTSLEEFSKSISSIQTVLYGYTEQDSKFQNVKITSFVSGNMNVIYKTKIYFSDKTEGTLNIGATKENGKWTITNFGAVAPPEHIKNR